MNTSKYIMALAIIIIVLISCQNKNNKDTKVVSVEVKHSGALRSIMSGKIESVINLDSLSEKKHLYALGAVENLNGEIQIFDSKPSNSFALDNTLTIIPTFSLNATLLVYAEVSAWSSFQIDKGTTKTDIENQIVKVANKNGIDVEKPFPFLLEGTFESIDWHVINWPEGDSIHNHKKHKESGLNGTLKNHKVQIIGFYSTKHKAVFTHHTTNMHMHFKTVDNTIAGHIDDLFLNGQAITLKLPKL